ncbi:site-specific recombinase XerC [Solibacillus silvestris StLB046]|uniref:Site-specific recombinase XerC n=1 Tax=Solibacillus silvestris (strain StLB046) TaxID=1002809 RepID=F2FA31_SOLSS|nr:site-specific recombinase XerC [Solibacillus silvestris StLB046]
MNRAFKGVEYIRKGRSKNTLEFEVKLIIKNFSHIGSSKKEARENSTKAIHSYKQQKKVLTAALDFIRFAKEKHQIKTLENLNNSIYKSYIGEQSKKGLKNGSIVDLETCLQLFQFALTRNYKNRGKTKPIFFYGRLVKKEKSTVVDRSISYEDYILIRDTVSKRVSLAVFLMFEFGLRLKEVSNIKVKHFDLKNNQIYIPAGEGAGVTKGGRYRVIPLESDKDIKLILNIADKAENDKVIEISYETIRKSVRNAYNKARISSCDKGCHRFRHSFARNRFKMYLSRINEPINHINDLLTKLDFEMKNSNSRYFYCKEGGLIQIVQLANKVLDELGHTKSEPLEKSIRRDLYLVYLAGTKL